jgi:branched-chain amino acid aminotransferase
MLHEAVLSKTSAQGYTPDPRNDTTLVYVNGEFVPRDHATVSIFDSGFIAEDGIWEGLRLVNGKLITADEHPERLFAGAKVIDLDIGLSREQVKELVWGDAAEKRYAGWRACPPYDHAGQEIHRQSRSTLCAW